MPTDLDGVYLRSTDNPVHPSMKNFHPFDGDGMIHLVGFRDEKAFYRNRFVRADELAAEQEAGHALWAGLAESPSLSLREEGWGARRRMKDVSSTDVIMHRGTALTSLTLPERISSGTHSTWAPGSELRRWQQTDTAAEAVGL